MKKGYKECPFCWEEIKEIAKKCRFCWEFFEEQKEVAPISKKKITKKTSKLNQDSRINKKSVLWWAIYVILVATIICLMIFTMSPAWRWGVIWETIAICLVLWLISLIFRKPIWTSEDYEKNNTNKEDKQSKWKFLIIWLIVLFFIVAWYNFFKHPVNKKIPNKPAILTEPVETIILDCFNYEYSKWKVTVWECKKFEVFIDWFAINWDFNETSFENVQFLKQALSARDNWVEPFLEVEVKNSNRIIPVQWISEISLDLNDISKEIYNKDINTLTDEELVWIEKLLSEYYHVLGNYDLYRDDTWNVKIIDMDYEWELSLSNLDLIILPWTVIDFNTLFKNVLWAEFWAVYLNDMQLEKLSDEINKETWYSNYWQPRYKLYLSEWHLILRDMYLNGDV